MLATQQNYLTPSPVPRHGAAFERYAVYYAPEPDTPLAHFGRTWFGYDAETGERIADRQDYGLGMELAARVTATPRRYGLHATLRSPFRPAADVDASALVEALTRFAAVHAPVPIGPVGLSRLGRFLALMPLGESGAVRHLHTECVLAFERFRAPATSEERATRLAAKLSADQKRLLEQWGYPYVLDEYRFHITLTGPLTAHEAERIAPVLIPALRDLQGERLEIGSLCLFGDPGDGAAFRLIERIPLAA